MNKVFSPSPATSGLVFRSSAAVFSRLPAVLALGASCLGLVGACSSKVDDCEATRTCGVTAGEGGEPGSAGKPPAGRGGAGGGGTSGHGGSTRDNGGEPSDTLTDAGRGAGRAGRGGADAGWADAGGADAGGADGGADIGRSGKGGSGGASPTGVGGAAGANTGQAAGEGGAAGEASAPCAACGAGQACSDEGACTCTAASCDGWCHGATCEPFETIAIDQPTFPATRGVALQQSDVYWTSSSNGDASADKYRVQRRTSSGQVQTLLSNQGHTLGPLLLGAERLFLLNTQTENLWSANVDGTNLRTDEWGVGTFRYRAGRVYWPEVVTSRFKELHIKSQSETDASDVVDEFSTVGDSNATFADIAFAGTQFAYALNMAASPDELGNYEIWVVNGGASRVFPTSPGHLEALECDSDDNYYWRGRAATTGGADLLMENDGASSPTAISTGVDVTDFTLFQPQAGSTLVYYAYTDPATETSGVRLYQTSSGKTYDVVKGDKAGSLVTDATHLYFFESNGHRLVRTPLPHVALGLGK